MIGGFSLRAIGGFIGFLALAGAVYIALGWRNERDALRDWQSGVVTATRNASGNPKLKADNVAMQVGLLGQAVEDLKGVIRRQNAAVTALGEQSAAQQAEADAAVDKAKGRVAAAEATADRLRSSARAPAPAGLDCAPSKALQEAWK